MARPPQNPMPRYRCRWLLGFALLAPAPAWLAPRRLALRLLAGSTASISVGCTAQELGDPGRKVSLGEAGEPGEPGEVLGNMLRKMPGENSLLGSLEMGQD